MKSWILLFIISATALGVFGFDKIEETKICVRETKVEPQALMDDTNDKSRNNPAVKCFHACMAKRAGWMLENGDIIQDKMLEHPISHYPEDQRSIIHRVHEICVNISTFADNHCETAYIMVKCLDQFRVKEE